MATVVIDFPGGDDNLKDMAKKFDQQTAAFQKTGQALHSLVTRGLSGGVKELLEAAGVAGPIAIGVGAVAATTAYLFTTAIEKSIRSTVAQYATGGTALQIGAMSGLGDMAGVGLPGMAGMATSLAERLREGGVASAWARNQGIVDLGPRTLNKVDNLEKTIDALRKVQDKNLRMFYTRELLGPDAGPLVEMPESARRISKWVGENTQLTDEQKASLANAKAKIIGFWEGLKTGGQQVIADISNTSGDYNWVDFINPFNPRWIDKSVIHAAQKEAESQQSRDEAIKENTEAIKEANRIARNERIHMGRRTGASVPSRWQGTVAEQMVRIRAMHLGGI